MEPSDYYAAASVGIIKAPENELSDNRAKRRTVPNV
jgi:hypothetical protein